MWIYLWWVWKKKHNIGFPTFKLPAGTFKTSFKTDPLNIIFDDFGIFLISISFSVRLLSVLRGYSVFSSPPHSQWPPTSKDIYTRSYPLHCFLILILEKEPVFPFQCSVLNKGNYWYHFYNVFGMTRSLTGGLNPGPPALDTSTLPLGYRGGGVSFIEFLTVDLELCLQKRNWGQVDRQMVRLLYNSFWGHKNNCMF